MVILELNGRICRLEHRRHSLLRRLARLLLF